MSEDAGRGFRVFVRRSRVETNPVRLHFGPDLLEDGPTGEEDHGRDDLSDVVAGLNASVVTEGIQHQESVGDEVEHRPVFLILGEDGKDQVLQVRHFGPIAPKGGFDVLLGRFFLLFGGVEVDDAQFVLAGTYDEREEVGDAPSVRIPGTLGLEFLEHVRSPSLPVKTILSVSARARKEEGAKIETRVQRASLVNTKGGKKIKRDTNPV